MAADAPGFITKSSATDSVGGHAEQPAIVSVKLSTAAVDMHGRGEEGRQTSRGR